MRMRKKNLLEATIIVYRDDIKSISQIMLKDIGSLVIRKFNKC